MKLTLLPAGKFLMGSPQSDPNAKSDERPQREVTITKPFYMGVTEVTQAQWRAVMGTEPWKGKRGEKEGGENAASSVIWDEATAFCAELSEKSGRTIRLPTEAHWEYACRAGSKTKFCFGDDDSKLGDYGWYTENAFTLGEHYAHAVARKKPNAWDLYDMHGNVLEWCQDWYGEKYYSATGNTVDPTGPPSGRSRVGRGGSYLHPGGGDFGTCRSADRHGFLRLGNWHVIYGFRVVSPVAAPN